MELKKVKKWRAKEAEEYENDVTTSPSYFFLCLFVYFSRFCINTIITFSVLRAKNTDDSPQRVKILWQKKKYKQKNGPNQEDGRTDGRTEPPASTLAFRELVDSAKNLQESCKHRQDLQPWTWNSVEFCLCVWDRQRKKRRKKKDNANRKLTLRVWRRIVRDAGISSPVSPTSPHGGLVFSFFLLFVCFSNYIFAQRCTLTHSPVHYFSWWGGRTGGRTDGRMEGRESEEPQHSDIVPVWFLYSGVLLTNCCFFWGLTCRREKHLVFGCWNKKINVSMLYPMNSEALESLFAWRQQTNVSGDWHVKKKKKRRENWQDSSLKWQTLEWMSWQQSSVSEQAPNWHLQNQTVQISKLKLT